MSEKPYSKCHRNQWPRRLAILLGLVVAGTVAMVAQVMKITGTVTDQEDEPLIGATVLVKGTTQGVSTDLDGHYALDARQGDVIMVSYVGCKPAQATVGTSNVINFTLESDSQVLDEVVVVGYGVVKKKDLTGSVAQVKGDKVAERRTTQLSNALQGAMAGVQVSRTNGQPGAGASDILIRGVTTIGDSSPLIIVDGVPVDNINDVNAADVENISVLKDAASAAIYG
ncbi:MAG: TonB-dependent receptor plug domain-containing protein, partial [Muribaculaceae bacterium]|nr:TonB-dependent receptor plug domain-containing protein [Muribaculaceae bacterium]